MLQNTPYKFRCKTYTQYEIEITQKADNKMLQHVFTKSREKLARVKGMNVSGDIDNIEAFDVNDKFLPLIKTTMRKSLGKIAADVKADGIELITMKAVKSRFERKDNTTWNIITTFQGDYTDNR